MIVSSTEATIDTMIIVRQPTDPPSGRTSTFRPRRTNEPYPMRPAATPTTCDRGASVTATAECDSTRALTGVMLTSTVFAAAAPPVATDVARGCQLTAIVAEVLAVRE